MPASALLIVSIVVAGLVGLVTGSFLTVVVHRVPAGIPLARGSRCPQCDAPIRGWRLAPVLSWIALGGRCAHCRARIAGRYPLVEAGTGVAFAGITWWFLVSDVSIRFARPGVPLPAGSLAVVIVAYLYFAAICIALALIDLDTHRLPNPIVVPSYGVMIVLFAIACLLGADGGALVRAGLGMAVLFAFYALLRVISPRGMGGGDVKLAGVVGLCLAWIGWPALVVGALAAFVLGGLFGVFLLVLRRASRRTAIPFGPWMILGAWVGIVTGQIVGDLYFGL